jgi:hypothetical protein
MCFLSNLRKISNIVPLGNQKAIALLEITPSKHLCIFRMKIHRFLWIDDNPFPAKLWLIEIDAETINLNVPDNTSDLAFNIFQIHLIKY